MFLLCRSSFLFNHYFLLANFLLRLYRKLEIRFNIRVIRKSRFPETDHVTVSENDVKIRRCVNFWSYEYLVLEIITWLIVLVTLWLVRFVQFRFKIYSEGIIGITIHNDEISYQNFTEEVNSDLLSLYLANYIFEILLQSFFPVLFQQFVIS